MQKSAQYGVTLTELVVGLAILAILAGIGVPSFSNSVKNARQGSAYNGLVGALHFARSESIRRNSNVTVCARATDNSCGIDWTQGWLVFEDNGATANAVDAGEEILRIKEPLAAGLSILATGSSITASSAYIVRTNIRFNPRGASSWRGGGSVAMCDSRGDDFLRAMVISVSGDIRRARKNPDGDIVVPWGGTVQC